jgi:hypothetical protein
MATVQGIVLEWHEGCEQSRPHRTEKTRVHRVRKTALADAVSISLRTGSVVYVNWRNVDTNLFHATVTAGKITVFPDA